MAPNPTKTPATSQAGQALIETLLSLPLVMTGVLVTLMGFYLALANFLIEHWVYQASLCLAKEYPKLYCTDNLRRELALLGFHQINKLQLDQKSFMARVRLVARDPINHSISYESSISLPLDKL